MLQYKKGRLYCQGVSFEIPENFYLETNGEMMFENGMVFISPDEKIWVEFAIFKSDMSSEEGLQSLINESDSFVVIDTVTPVTINGLSGHYCYYKTTRENFLTVQLNISENFVFGYTIRSIERNVKDVMEEPVFNRSLMQIKKD